MSVIQYYAMLSSALCKLEREIGGQAAWEMIIEESGVYNVKAIAEGEITPTIESWQQLYRAFPDKIPPP